VDEEGFFGHGPEDGGFARFERGLGRWHERSVGSGGVPATSRHGRQHQCQGRRQFEPAPTGRRCRHTPGARRRRHGWHIIGLGFLGGVVLAMIFVGNDEDDEEVPTTTTSN